MPAQWTKERVGEQGLADINARPPNEGESKRERRNGVLKRKEMALKKNEKMAITKMALTIRGDGAQAESGGDEKRQRKWGNKKRSPKRNSL